MLLTWTEIKWRHPTTALCARGADQKIWQLAEEEARAGAVIAFREHGQPLETVKNFSYLRRLLTAMGYEWPYIIGNLQ